MSEDINGFLCLKLNLCIAQIEASTCPPPGIPRAFDTFAISGRREFDPHALGVGNLNCTLDFMYYTTT